MPLLRVMYGGSPACSAKLLELLLRGAGAEYEVAAVLTKAPSARGRHSEPVPTEVARCALAWSGSISVLTPESLRGAALDDIARLGCDIFVCFAYGRILGPRTLSLFKFGALNLHPSLLPKYRGASPAQAAILNGDSESGFSLQKMSPGMDEGDLLVQERFPLGRTETTEDILSRCALWGGEHIARILKSTARTGALPLATPQAGEASYCRAIKKEDGRINWEDSAEKIDAMLRAYTPWPSCFTDAGGCELKILKGYAADADRTPPPPAGTVLGYDRSRGVLIQTGRGVLVAQALQWQAKKAMDHRAFMNGARNFIGTILE